MKVIFKTSAYIDGHFFKRDAFAQEVPEQYRNQLPSTAKIVGEAPPPAPPKEPSFKDFDEARPAAEAEQKLQNKFSKPKP
jgi:hypothetical protein